MISVDLILLVIAVGGAIVAFANRRALKNAHASLGIFLVLTGLWTGSFLYLADLYAMTVLPPTIGQAEAMKVMRALHLEYSWYINAASAFLVFIGLFVSIMQIVRQMNLVEGHSRALAESESLLESVFQNVPVGILIKDKDSVVERPNDTYLNWYGISAAELLGKQSREIEQFQPFDDAAVMTEQENYVLETGKTLSRQVKRQFADGMDHVVNITKFPIYDRNGEINKVGSVSVDLTELVEARQRAEEARAEAESANRSKSTFLANMSHELRTPLNAILGFSEIIKTEAFGALGNPQYLEYATFINDSGRLLLDLINDLLDLSKIEAGGYELEEETIDINDLIHNCVLLVQKKAESESVKVIQKVPTRLPDVYADVRAMKQILINLLSNAIKFTEPGGTVAVRAWVGSSGDFVLQVADTGIGIALDDIPAALSPFRQATGNYKSKEEGTGLGLPLAKSLTEMHGGSLNLQSEVGVGTTVTLRFPAERLRPLSNIPPDADGDVGIAS